MRNKKMKISYSGFNLILFSLIFLTFLFNLTEKIKAEAIFISEKSFFSEEARFPKTRAGEKASLFSQAFITADRASLERFFAQYMPADKLKTISAEERAMKLLSLRERLGNIVSVKINNPSPEEFFLFYQGEKDEGCMINLKFESKNESIYLVAVTVEQADSESFLPSVPHLPLDQALEQIDHQIKELSVQDKFSGVVLIARDFKPVYFKAWGLASREFGVPNQLMTKFNLGSINKLFTKIAVAQLIEKGLLSLDDRLGKFLPDYPNPEAREKVKVRHLIEMTSGIGDFFGPDFEKTPKDFLRHNRDYLGLFAHKPLAFEPGSKQMYSNGSYVVLGEIISRASGIDYYEFVRKNIFDIAGMKDSAWYEADEPIPNLAEGYTREISGRHMAVSNEKGELSLNENSLERKGRRDRNETFAGKKEISNEGLIKLRTMIMGSENQEKKEEKGTFWRKNIYTRPARGSAAGGGYSTAEDLLKFIQALCSCQLLSPPWTDWVLGGPEPVSEAKEKTLTPDRKKWNLGVAGGAPGINAVLEFDGSSGWTIIVLANLDPPSATTVSHLIRRHLPAKGDTNIFFPGQNRESDWLLDF